jgi:phosphoribosylaminoimidazolecarboxamide formyltransferase/IMP cyclohydrolase
VFAKKKNLRLLITGGLPDPATPGLYLKTVAGGFLAQSRDNGRVTAADLKFVTKKKPTDAQIRDMIFAFKVAKHVKSNAIIYAKDSATVGIGAGQMSRVDSARVARLKAEDVAHANGWSDPKTIGSVCASDAFFPFPDGLLQAVQAGSTAVIQPGGSIRDEDVIKAADEAEIAMAFTGMRHFRH